MLTKLCPIDYDLWKFTTVSDHRKAVRTIRAAVDDVALRARRRLLNPANPATT